MDPFLKQAFNKAKRCIVCEPHPKRWRAFCQQHALEWQSVPFRRGGGEALPAQAGFYCFYVGEPPNGLPRVLFPLYAGETADLRRRYRDYVREKDRENGRFKIRLMLKVFSGEVAFAYALYDGELADRRRTETQLNDALMPPFGQKDFSAEIKRGRRPFG